MRGRVLLRLVFVSVCLGRLYVGEITASKSARDVCDNDCTENTCREMCAYYQGSTPGDCSTYCQQTCGIYGDYTFTGETSCGGEDCVAVCQCGVPIK
jgi:hypothetical protein